MACPLAAERIWTEKSQYQQAEQKYFEHLSKVKLFTYFFFFFGKIYKRQIYLILRLCYK